MNFYTGLKKFMKIVFLNAWDLRVFGSAAGFRMIVPAGIT